MSLNLFDEYLHDDEQLNGFLSKIAKGIRNVGRKVRKVVKKVTPKPLRKVIEKVEAEGRRLDKKGITKKLAIAAIGVAGLVVGGPAIAAGLKTAAGAAGSIIAKGGALAVKGISAAATAAKAVGVANLVKTGVSIAQAKQTAQQEAYTAADQAYQETKATEQLAQVIGANPKFAEVVQQLRAQGYSDDAILQHWVESKTYYEQAFSAVAETVYPQLYNYGVQAGLPPQAAEYYAASETEQIADEAINKVRSEFTGAPILIGAGLLALLLLK